MGDAVVEAEEASADFLFLRQLGQGASSVRVTDPLTLGPNESAVNLISLSNARGLLFAATEDGFIAYKLSEVRRLCASSSRNESPRMDQPLVSAAVASNPSLGAKILFLRVADQESSLVTGLANGRIAVWTISDLLQGITTSTVILQPPSPNLTLLELAANPSDRPELCVALYSTPDRSPLHAGIAVVLDLRTGQWGSELKPANGSGTTSLCWSVKGKQVALGLEDGSIAQVTPEGQMKDTVPKPHDLPASNYVEQIFWLENHTFLVTYNERPSSEEPEHQYQVYSILRDNASKKINFVHFVDPAPPFGDTSRKGHRYVCWLRGWEPTKHMFFIANTSSTDVGLLGCRSQAAAGASAWQNLDLEDTSRPVLPFSSLDKTSDTSPIGLGLDCTSDKKVDDPQAASRGEDGTGKLDPMPILYIYTNDGLLIAYTVINVEPNGGKYPGMNPVSLASTTGTAPAEAVMSTDDSSHGLPAAAVQGSSVPSFGKISAFGGFGSAAPPASAVQGSSVPSFGKPSAFGGFGTAAPAFGQPSPFAAAAKATTVPSSTPVTGGFGAFSAKPVTFGQKSSTSDVFGSGNSTGKKSDIFTASATSAADAAQSEEVMSTDETSHAPSTIKTETVTTEAAISADEISQSTPAPVSQSPTVLTFGKPSAFGAFGSTPSTFGQPSAFAATAKSTSAPLSTPTTGGFGNFAAEQPPSEQKVPNLTVLGTGNDEKKADSNAGPSNSTSEMTATEAVTSTNNISQGSASTSKESAVPSFGKTSTFDGFGSVAPAFGQSSAFAATSSSTSVPSPTITTGGFGSFAAKPFSFGQKPSVFDGKRTSESSVGEAKTGASTTETSATEASVSSISESIQSPSSAITSSPLASFGKPSTFGGFGSSPSAFRQPSAFAAATAPTSVPSSTSVAGGFGAFAAKQTSFKTKSPDTPGSGAPNDLKNPGEKTASSASKSEKAVSSSPTKSTQGPSSTLPPSASFALGGFESALPALGQFTPSAEAAKGSSAKPSTPTTGSFGSFGGSGAKQPLTGQQPSFGQKPSTFGGFGLEESSGVKPPNMTATPTMSIGETPEKEMMLSVAKSSQSPRPAIIAPSIPSFAKPAAQATKSVGEDARAPVKTKDEGLQIIFLDTFLTMEKELKVLMDNVDRCRKFHETIRAPNEVVLGLHDLSDGSMWTFGELDTKSKLTSELTSSAEKILQGTRAIKIKLKEVQGQQLKADVKEDEIARFARARKDPLFSKMLRVRQLGPEHAENQERLRLATTSVKEAIQDLEVHLDKMRRMAMDEKTGARGALRAPSLDAIRRTARNITQSARIKLMELQELEIAYEQMIQIGSKHIFVREEGSNESQSPSSKRLSAFTSLHQMEESLPSISPPAIRLEDQRVMTGYSAAAALEMHKKHTDLKSVFLSGWKEPVLNRVRKSDGKPAEDYDISDLNMAFAKGAIKVAPTPTESRPAASSKPISFSSTPTNGITAAKPQGPATFTFNPLPVSALSKDAFQLPPEDAPFSPGGASLSSSSTGRGHHTSSKSASKKGVAVPLTTSSPFTSSSPFSSSSTSDSKFFERPGQATLATGHGPAKPAAPFSGFGTPSFGLGANAKKPTNVTLPPLSSRLGPLASNITFKGLQPMKPIAPTSRLATYVNANDDDSSGDSSSDVDGNGDMDRPKSENVEEASDEGGEYEDEYEDEEDGEGEDVYDEVGEREAEEDVEGQEYEDEDEEGLSDVDEAEEEEEEDISRKEG